MNQVTDETNSEKRSMPKYTIKLLRRLNKSIIYVTSEDSNGEENVLDESDTTGGDKGKSLTPRKIKRSKTKMWKKICQKRNQLYAK
ncbi:hypothetical protein CEXT_709661 [Caerostris extrusa]|uniref:Uncharacterized protein n=1 Tax=Caerostris extrusa TaxID=172846 RepID=A0AAV4UK60_CAEEX|nr:hypothetical protein CEXT_709661 [Caerostris extrusa]